MKTKITFYNLAITSIVILFVCGCKKDDTSTTTTPKPSTTTSKDTLYYVQYDGKKYQMDNAHIYYSTLFASTGGGNIYYAYFVTKGVAYNSNFNEMKGTGDGLMLSINAQSAISSNGIYTIDTLNNSFDLGEVMGSFFINCQFSNFPSSSNSDQLHSGSFSFSQVSTDTVLVTGSCKTNKNKSLKLYYKGVMPRTEIYSK